MSALQGKQVRARATPSGDQKLVGPLITAGALALFERGAPNLKLALKWSAG
jgi:hypothetical protein